MSEGNLSIRKMAPVIIITWILSLVTTLALVYFAPYVPIGTDKIADSAVTSGKIADGAVITTLLADGSVSSAKIMDGTILAQDIADGSIVSVKIKDGAITATKIADGSVSTGKIADNAIVTVKLADDSVTTEKIAEGNITTALLSDNAIITIKLADGAVTSAKILDGTITTIDLADGAITSVKIADNAITTAKIADYAVTNQKLAPDAIPIATTSVLTENMTTSVLYEDMPHTNVNITLSRPSNLIIIFSSQLWLETPNQAMRIRALTNGGYTLPGEYSATIPPSEWCESRTFHFYASVDAGTHSIKIQWGVTGGEAWAGYRILTVIALPA